MTEVIGVIGILLAVYALASGSGLFAERSGTINLSIEGGMTFGALGYVMTTHSLTNSNSETLQVWMVLIGLIVAIIFGIVATSLLSFTAINLRGNQIVIGTAINIMVPIISLITVVAITSGNFSVPMTKLQMTTGLDTPLLAWEIQLIVASVILVMMLGLFVLMRMTKFGLRLRAAGENPHALAATGVSVYLIKHLAMLISGILAGFAGGIVVSAYSKYSSYANTTLGMGFIAIAILILGQWRMQWIILGSLLFAIMYSIVDHYAVVIGEFKYLLSLIPYLFTLMVLPFISEFSKPPAADGIPYVNTGR
ncbi:MAG: ABC transporter permease [Mycoplasmatales bacterium]|nr:ABC transporter permease [Mycoplasmatales bacterium]